MSQGEFLTVMIKNRLHNHAEWSREDWYLEELAQRLILFISKMSKYSANFCSLLVSNVWAVIQMMLLQLWNL